MPPHSDKIWVEQCDAAERLRVDIGLEQALSYLVGEKLIDFLGAAAARPELAGEVTAFAERVRDIFEPQELRRFFDRPREQELAPDLEDTEPDDLVRAAEKLMLEEQAKELLL